jgi:parvulin-like peptidyl-prolyl isomerase
MPMPETIVTVPNNKITLQDSIEEAKISGKFTELIQGFLRRQIIAQQAQQLGIEATAQELQVAADLLRKNQKLDTAEATLKWLKTNFLSVDDFEKIVVHKLITEKLAQHLFGDRVEHYFHQNTLEYGGATIYEVVLDNRELAMEIFYSLQEGDLNFADVAHQYIPDSEHKRRGGYLGTVNRKQLRPEISAAVFAAKPPQLIDPVVTAIGVHLIYVEKINQAKLDDLLRQKILMDMFDAWLDEQVTSVSGNISIEL